MPSALSCCDRRRDHGQILLAERAFLAGMRIEPRDREPRTGDAEALAQVARHDPAGREHEVGGQRADHVPERQVDGDRDHRELGRPQHHDRMVGSSGRFRGELGEIFGVSGLGEARAVEHVLGHRVGDDRGRDACGHVGDRAADRGDRRRRARPVRLAGLRAHGDADVDDRQRGLEGSRGGGRLDDRNRYVRRHAPRPSRQECGIAQQVERRQVQFGAPPPCREGDVGTNTGRLAERQGEGQ